MKNSASPPGRSRIAAVDVVRGAAQIISAPQLIPDWYGVSPPGVYVAWATVVLLLYVPCRRFAQLKDTRGAWWLRCL